MAISIFLTEVDTFSGYIPLSVYFRKRFPISIVCVELVACGPTPTPPPQAIRPNYECIHFCGLLGLIVKIATGACQRIVKSSHSDIKTFDL